MTERTPPAWLQSGSYPAEDDRRLIATLFGDSEGIFASTDLAVTQRGAGANMSVDIAGGRCVIKGDQATYEGSYFMENRGVTNLVVSASDPTNPRIDRVIAEVLNAEYSGASNLWRLRVMTGTPAASPVAPTLPNNAISLATIAVAAGSTSVVNANITDTRTQAWLFGGTIVCTSTTRPSAPFEGMRIYELDTDQELVYSGSAWVVTARLGGWISYTPTWVQGVAVNKTVTYAKYVKLGRTVIGSMLMVATNAATANNPITVGTPVTAAQAGFLACGSGYFNDTSATLNYPVVAIMSTTSTIAFLATDATTGAQLGVTGSAFSGAVASGDSITVQFMFESAT